MILIRHRVNTVAGLLDTPEKYGVELDIRSKGGKLMINHEPFEDGEIFDEYLKHFRHAFMFVDIKEEGIEKAAIALLEKHQIANYCLLGVTPPFMIKLMHEGIKKMAVRFSEYESLETCRQFARKVNYVWIDTFTKLPLDRNSSHYITKNFKSCLVCPERWGRANDIRKYRAIMEKDGITVDMVMTSKEHFEGWEK